MAMAHSPPMNVGQNAKTADDRVGGRLLGKTVNRNLMS